MDSSKREDVTRHEFERDGRVASGRGRSSSSVTNSVTSRHERASLPREVSAIYFTLTTTLPFARPVSMYNEPTLDALAAGLSARRGKEVGRPEAAAFLGLLVGTLQLARATPDRAESDAILEAGVCAALRLAE